MSAKSTVIPYIGAYSDLVSDDEAFLAGVNEFSAIQGLLWGSSLYRELMVSPSINLKTRERVLRSALDAAGTSDIVKKVLVLMLRKGRFAELENLIPELRDFADKRCFICRGQVESAVELQPSDRSVLEAILIKGFNRVELSYSIDENLIAGIRVRMGGVVLDASVDRKIKELLKRITKA